VKSIAQVYRRGEGERKRSETARWVFEALSLSSDLKLRERDHGRGEKRKKCSFGEALARRRTTLSKVFDDGLGKREGKEEWSGSGRDCLGGASASRGSTPRRRKRSHRKGGPLVDRGDALRPPSPARRSSSAHPRRRAPGKEKRGGRRKRENAKWPPRGHDRSGGTACASPRKEKRRGGKYMIARTSHFLLSKKLPLYHYVLTIAMRRRERDREVKGQNC